jgi:hypothetical protein
MRLSRRPDGAQGICGPSGIAQGAEDASAEVLAQIGREFDVDLVHWSR